MWNSSNSGSNTSNSSQNSSKFPWMKLSSTLNEFIPSFIPSFLVPSRPQNHLDNLPNELILQVFPHLPLKSLIAAQGVCQKWRQLVPCSDILPARRDLLKFYLKIVHSPHFELTRPWVLANLRPFDRQGFVDSLLEQHNYLPEVFRLWILEWPARAVVGCVWPGLPNENCDLISPIGVERVNGCNWLGKLPAVVSTLKTIPKDSTPKHIPVITIWTSDNGIVWLMLDGPFRDKVCITESPLFREGGNNKLYDGWLGWQKCTWRRMEKACENLSDETRHFYYECFPARGRPPTPWVGFGAHGGRITMSWQQMLQQQ